MKHLAIIADGNRRWAKSNGLSSRFGYNQGLITIENCCDWAIKNKIDFITFYCFSTENWRRPQEEIDLLEKMAAEYFYNQLNWYVEKDIKIKILGRKDRINEELMFCLLNSEKTTQNCKTLTVTICIDYGGRDEIARAISAGAKTEEEITQMLTKDFPEPEIILRTGGRKRLSNFLLWQSAYSELFFLDCFFPDLTDKELDEVLREYQHIERNLGG